MENKEYVPCESYSYRDTKEWRQAGDVIIITPTSQRKD